MNDQQLLALCHGERDQIEFLEEQVYDSVVEGICRECHGTQEAEPDATANVCYECGERKVVSCLVLAGLI
jgi:hypothetical protein